MKRYYIAMAILVIVGILTIGLNYVTSLPLVQDSQKVTDIVRLQSEISNYFNDKSALPSSLSELSRAADLGNRLGDYTYTKKGFATYDLCATFNIDTQITSASIAADRSSPHQHQRGYQCFTTTLQLPYHQGPAEDQPAESL